jgi:hypothetical protein
MHAQGDMMYSMQHLINFACRGTVALESGECTGENDEAREEDPSEQAR